MALLEEGPEHYAAWKHLCAILRDGQPSGFVREFGHPLFVHAVEDPEYGAVFNAAMSSYANSLTPMVLEALATNDFSTIAHVCDVGGGHGDLLCSLLTKYPALRGTIYELASVIADTDRLWVPKMGVGERCTYVAGDMFREVPAADVYLLKRILHDWSDSDTAVFTPSTAAQEAWALFSLRQILIRLLRLCWKELARSAFRLLSIRYAVLCHPHK